jgi:flagellar motor switch protein FliG
MRRSTVAGGTNPVERALSLARSNLDRTAFVCGRWIQDRRDDAAILLLLLGEQHAREVFIRLEADEITLLGAAVLGLAVVERRRVSRAARAFISAADSLSVLVPDPSAFLRSALTGAFGERQIQRLEVAMLASSQGSTTAILRALPREVMAAIVEQEHPQVGAAMLDQLIPEHAQAVCVLLAPDVALELRSRLARLQPITPEAMADLHTGLLDKLLAGDWDHHKSTTGQDAK